MKQLLTASRMGCFQSCPRKHYWRYEVGLKSSTKSGALRFGSGWHNAMEKRWQGADFKEALAAALPEGVDLDALQAETLSGLLVGYYHRYGHPDSYVHTMHPETEFRHAINGSRSFDSAGKIDGLGVLHDGRIVLWEHKTCSEDLSPESDYWVRLRFNSQVLQYVYAARQLGWDVETVVYDVTRKPSIRQKKDETVEEFGTRLSEDTMARPDFYFARREVPVLDQDLEEFEVQRLVLSRNILGHRAAQMKLNRPEQAWPRVVASMQCGFCEYSTWCLQNISVDLNNPPAGFAVGEINEELNQTK